MSNKAYDILKTISLLIAPIAVFAASIFEIWGIPYGTQITATIAAIDVLVGAIVTVAKRSYDRTNQIEAPEETDQQEDR